MPEPDGSRLPDGTAANSSGCIPASHPGHPLAGYVQYNNGQNPVAEDLRKNGPSSGPPFCAEHFLPPTFPCLSDTRPPDTSRSNNNISLTGDVAPIVYMDSDHTGSPIPSPPIDSGMPNHISPEECSSIPSLLKSIPCLRYRQEVFYRNLISKIY